MVLEVLLSGALGYLIGSTPFGLIVARIGYRVDIRDHGSGNIGATNVLRIIGLLPSVGVLLADVTKGLLAVTASEYIFAAAVKQPFGSLIPLTAAFMVIVGHNFSVYLRFSGGKGVSTALGAFFALDPVVATVLLIVWSGLLAVTRYVSVASITASVVLPIISILRHPQEPLFVSFGFLIAALVLFQHRGNMRRLLAGEESQVFKVKGSGSRVEN